MTKQHYLALFRSGTQPKAPPPDAPKEDFEAWYAALATFNRERARTKAAMFCCIWLLAATAVALHAI
jgi:hypothetical protein